MSNIGNVYIADTYNNRIRKVTVATSNPRYADIFNSILSYFNYYFDCYNKFNFSSPSPSTALPSQTPLYQPTVKPTTFVEVSIFATQNSAKTTEAKTRYYLGSFIAYFAGLYVIIYLFKRSKYGAKTVHSLYESAYESGFYKQYSENIVPSKGNVLAINDVILRNKELSSLIDNEATSDGANRISTVDNIVRLTYTKEKEIIPFTKCKSYMVYCSQYRHILGCKPVIFPSGLTLNFYFFTVSFPPGHFENFTLFLCLNHQFFNAIYFIDPTGRFGSRGRILVYVVKESCIFVLAQFLTALTEYYSVDNFQYIHPFINIFIITPISIFVGFILINLYTAPCVETDLYFNRTSSSKRVIIFLSRSFIVPVIILLTGSLVLACLFTSGSRVPLILFDFFITVQLTSILIQIIKYFGEFTDNYTCQIRLFGKPIWYIGSIFVEHIVGENLKLNVDYFVSEHFYFGFHITTILCRKDAIRKGLVTDTTVCSNPIVSLEESNHNSALSKSVVNAAVTNQEEFVKDIDL